MENKTFPTSETQTESKGKRSSEEQQLQQQQQETRGLALRCLFARSRNKRRRERERIACPGWAGWARGTRLALTCPPGGPRAVPTDIKKTFRAERTGPKRSDVWGRGLRRRRRRRWVGAYKDLDWDVDWACMRTWMRTSMAMDMGSMRTWIGTWMVMDRVRGWRRGYPRFSIRLSPRSADKPELRNGIYSQLRRWNAQIPTAQ